MLATTLWKIDLRLGASYSSPFCFWTCMEKWHGNLNCFGREFASSLYSLKCIWKCYIVWKALKHHYSAAQLLNIYIIMEAMRCYFPLDAHLCVYGGGGRGLSGFYSGSCHSFCWYELCLLSDKFLFFYWYENSLQCIYSALQQPECFKCHSEQLSSMYLQFDHGLLFNCIFWAWLKPNLWWD